MRHDSPKYQMPYSSSDLPERAARLEVHREVHESRLEDHSDRLDAVTKRMSLHEKAILAILAVLQVILQDKYPALAKILKAML